MIKHSEDNRKFKLLGFTKPSNISQYQAQIMVLTTGMSMKVKLSELVKNRDIMDDLNKQEIEMVCKRHYWPDQFPATKEIRDRNENSWIIYTLLSVFLITLFTFSNIAASKPIYLEKFDIVVTPGLFVYPFTFLIVDLLNEFYGLRLAKKAIFFAFFSNGFIISFLYATTFLPGIPSWPMTTPYNDLIKQISSVLIASSASFLFSEYVNSYLLCKIKELTNSRFLFLRVFFSTLFAIIIDSFLFCFIAFSNTMENSEILKIVYIQILVKVLFAFFNIFPAYGARALFRKFIIV